MTDAWTSLGSKALIALTVHYEKNGEVQCLLLDVVKVPVSHSGFNLATTFAKILQEFGISDKVSTLGA